MTPRYFSEWDFENATPPCRMSDMDPELLERLDVARFHAGIPIQINSAFRTVEHEKSRGRAGTSSHVTGKAVDIRAIGSRERFLILSALIKAGFHRIGIAKNNIHADCDEDKDPQVIWTYYP